MRIQILARVAPLIVFLLCASQGWGDAVIIAGQRFESPSRFVITGDEIYAPLLPALKRVGVTSQVTPDSIKLTTSRLEILISRVRPEATRNGVLRTLPAIPRIHGKEILFPSRAVGSLLGYSVRWDELSHTLFMHPYIRKFNFETLPDRYRVTVEAEGPITYRTGRLEGPPRLFLDLLNMDLADIPSEAVVEESYLKSVRIKQKSLAPDPQGDVVRLVIEMAEWKPYRIRLNEDRRLLKIDFALPGESEVPPDAPPVILTDLAFTRLSPQMAEISLASLGRPFCVSGNSPDSNAIWVEVLNAENRLHSPQLSVADKLVSSISVAPIPERPGSQRVNIILAQPIGHTIISETNRVRIMLGEVNLAGVCVVVDAGHGGRDTGAIGQSGLCEKDVNLDIACRTARVLETMGAKVVLTRPGDECLRPWELGNREQHREDLLARCSVANDINADLFVSIHANARAGNRMAFQGTETYYRTPISAAFARVMQEEVVKAIGWPDGSAMRHPKPIVVLGYTNMPAVLVEVAYLSNPLDEIELASLEFRDKAAQGIANGVKRYAFEAGLLPILQREKPSDRVLLEKTPNKAQEDRTVKEEME